MIDPSLGTIPDDPSLPSLGPACDPAQMLYLFRIYLVPVLKKPCQILDCTLSRIRYRPRTRCILQYTLHMLEPDTGHEWKQWVTGMIYSGDRAERILKKIRSASPEYEISNYLITDEPAFFITDLNMLVQVFPYDRRIPTLPYLTGELSSDLMHLFRERFGQGNWNVEICNIKPVRYRAGLGGVLQYTVKALGEAAGRIETKRFYAKVYRKDEDQGKQTYQLLENLWKRTGYGNACFKVARPVAYLEDLNALIQEEAPGISLHDILLRGGETGSAMRKAARTLAQFNQDNLVPGRRYSLDDQISESREIGEFCSVVLPSMRKR